MTYEEMKAEAEKVAEALRAAGYSEVSVLDFEPGETPDVMFSDENGNEFFVTLGLA